MVCPVCILPVLAMGGSGGTIASKMTWYYKLLIILLILLSCLGLYWYFKNKPCKECKA